MCFTYLYWKFADIYVYYPSLYNSKYEIAIAKAVQDRVPMEDLCDILFDYFKGPSVPYKVLWFIKSKIIKKITAKPDVKMSKWKLFKYKLQFNPFDKTPELYINNATFSFEDLKFLCLTCYNYRHYFDYIFKLHVLLHDDVEFTTEEQEKLKLFYKGIRSHNFNYNYYMFPMDDWRVKKCFE